MSTLYFTNASCSKAAFIANKVANAGFKTEGVQFDFVGGKHTVKSSSKTYRDIIPKGNVPGLVMADGTVLSEGIAVHQAISAAAPAANLFAGAPGSSDYLKALEFFSYIATDVHAGSIALLFSPLGGQPEASAFIAKKLETKLSFLSENYLKGGKLTFFEGKLTSADLYLMWALEAAAYKGVKLSAHLQSVLDHISNLPNVKSAIAECNAAFA